MSSMVSIIIAVAVRAPHLPGLIVPGANVVAGDAHAPAVAEVVDIVANSGGDVVLGSGTIAATA